MRAIIINESNYVANSGNRFIKKFNSPLPLTSNSEMSLHSLDLYLSWQNINHEQYNNSTFSYTWVDGITYMCRISNGGYNDISELNLYFLKCQDQNLHYLTDNNGKRVYFMEFVENTSNYRIQLNIDALPQVLPNGWTKSNASWSLPSGSNRTPQVNILSTSNFGSVIGFNTGTYPQNWQSNDYSTLGQTVPIINPISSIIIRCNAVNSNSGGVIDDLLFTACPNAKYGSLISIRPNIELWMPVTPNIYSELSFSLFDQNFNPMQLLDTQILAVILIR